MPSAAALLRAHEASACCLRSCRRTASICAPRGVEVGLVLQRPPVAAWQLPRAGAACRQLCVRARVHARPHTHTHTHTHLVDQSCFQCGIPVDVPCRALWCHQPPEGHIFCPLIGVATHLLTHPAPVWHNKQHLKGTERSRVHAQQIETGGGQRSLCRRTVQYVLCV
jgi:hypothetical protein